MELNETKKSLYKEKPTALFLFADKSGLKYFTELDNGQIITFLIPFNDLGDATFAGEMDAKLLIRWIIQKQ